MGDLSIGTARPSANRLREQPQQVVFAGVGPLRFVDAPRAADFLQVDRQKQLIAHFGILACVRKGLLRVDSI